MTLPRIHLVDLQQDLTDAAHEIGWADHIMCWPGTDVRDVDMRPGTAFVSPANSIGFMDGGIDRVLSSGAMFPDAERRVKAAFASTGHKTLLGRPYLPIGQAVTVPTQHKDVFVIAAPTMWLQQDVRDTHNAYHATYAILREATRHPEINRIIVPGLCTGFGRMPPEVAIAQMEEAHRDFVHRRPPRFSAHDIAEEQPNFYMNTEFKPIPPGAVVHLGHCPKDTLDETANGRC